MKNRKYKIILCEGETDQILIGSYLEKIGKWTYFKGKNLPFHKESINWFTNSEEDFLGIWQVGGNNFTIPLKEVLDLAHLESSIQKLAIITDHDDNDAETVRPSKLLSVIGKELNTEAAVDLQWIGQWKSLTFQDSFKAYSVIELCYILVPLNMQGALETFMLESLAEQAPEKEGIICQARDFINNIKSNVYLTKRREKVKAQLGVSLSVFSPDRIFTTMDELLKSVNWAEFQTAHEQFKALDNV
jgi:hypothetical protein